METRSSARGGVILFLLLTFVPSWLLQVVMIADGRAIDEQVGAVIALMWTPALASIVCRLVRREGIGDVSFRIGRGGGLRPWLVAWLFPVVVGLLAYGGAWISGLATFAAPATSGLGLAEMAAVPRLFVTIGIALTLGVVFSAITATGEEIGWRGYLFTRLVASEVPHPVLVAGAIWGLWHLPLIVSGQYAAGPWPALSAMVFLVSILAGGAIAAYVRAESGSVWAAALFHASWNSVIQGPFDGFTEGGGAAHTTSIWIGESGIVVALVSVGVAVLVLGRGFAVRLTPSSEPIATCRT